MAHMHEKLPEERPGQNGPNRPRLVGPGSFWAWFAALFDLVPPRTISGSDVKRHKGIHSSFVATRSRTRRLDQQESTRRPSSTSEVSTPCPMLQCVTLWVKSLFVLGVEGGSWVVITKPMFWIYLLSYSFWWCFNLNGRLACFGVALLVVSRIVFLFVLYVITVV
jgi:hypothetical protein